MDKAIGIGKCAERAVTISPCGESQFLAEELLQTSELLAGYADMLSDVAADYADADYINNNDTSRGILRSQVDYAVVLLKAQSQHLRRIVEDVRGE